MSNPNQRRISAKKFALSLQLCDEGNHSTILTKPKIIRLSEAVKKRTLKPAGKNKSGGDFRETNRLENQTGNNLSPRFPHKIKKSEKEQ
jgi:hypothetical protein